MPQTAGRDYTLPGRCERDADTANSPGHGGGPQQVDKPVKGMRVIILTLQKYEQMLEQHSSVVNPRAIFTSLVTGLDWLVRNNMV